MQELKNIIEKAWENRELLKESKTQEAIRELINCIDSGTLRCAEPTKEGWQINEGVKKGVVLYVQPEIINKVALCDTDICRSSNDVPIDHWWQQICGNNRAMYWRNAHTLRSREREVWSRIPRGAWLLVWMAEYLSVMVP